MLFSSLVFLFVFLPFVIIGYYLMPIKQRNTFLLFTSLIFFAWAGVSYSILMFVSITINFLLGKKLKSPKKKFYLKLGIGFNILMLIVFKYTNFIVDNINNIFDLFSIKQIPETNIILPIGISFYTFQAMSYLIDVYYGRTQIQKRIDHLGLYIALFPQLIAGPIVRYHEIKDQILHRVHDIDKFAKGVKRFIFGLGKKVLLANSFAAIVDQVFIMPIDSIDFYTAWIVIVLYALQIYFDFSGYSDMAIGLGYMFGFRIPENFNYPYIAASIKEFWRLWHITLSSWFRDYLYIPLGGNRKGRGRTLINLLLVFAITGFWHGASWNFLIWGLFHGFFLLIERLGFENSLKKTLKIFQHTYTIVIVLFAWVFFRSENLEQALSFCNKMLGLSDGVTNIRRSYILNYYTSRNALFFVFGILISTPFFPKIWSIFNLSNIKVYPPLKLLLQNSVSLAKVGFVFGIFILCIMELTIGTYNPFIYFRF